MPLNELLSHPGLDFHILCFLGPCSFHRLSACSCFFKNDLPQPLASWHEAWLASIKDSDDAAALEVVATDMLRQEDVKWKEFQWEELIDKTFTLTSRGRPKVDGSFPTQNLLDVAVQRMLRPVIPLLRYRGYTLEFLDAYSFEIFVQEDDFEAVSAYLEAGISPDIRVNAGRSVLMVSMAFKSPRVMQLLLDWNADVHQRSGFGQWTALMWATHVGWEDGCRALLRSKADVSDQNTQQKTALDIANSLGRQGVIDILNGTA
eukprot:TRINITY_DN39609_c0_g1_i1.p1 TRINITY_DN39609_c0_g1~~TRINITY_DN39609_c0_g1_i1.p1  ORF type:complete len:261 (+),score=30.58 TRINITY_DN39609_c0_g1_i1:37-819(+)